MGIGSGTAIALTAGLGGTVASGVLGEQAASTQAAAANNAAQLQAYEAQQSLNQQASEFNTTQANEAPFIQAGQGAVGQLSQLLGVGSPPVQGNPGLPPGPGNPVGGQAPGVGANGRGLSLTGPPAVNPQSPVATTALQARNGQGQLSTLGGPQQAPQGTTATNIGGVNYNLPTGGGNSFGSLNEPWTAQFQAPTAAQAAQTPGYQFALQQGEQALQNSAAAQGNLLSGGTGKALEQYGQGLADTNYQQVYNNAFNQYSQAYNQFNNNQTNEFNRLASVAGLGQTSTAQLGQLGQSAANNASNTLLTTGAQQGQNINNAGAATASGYASLGNTLNSGLGNLGSLSLLSQSGLLNGGNYNNASDNPNLINNPGTVIPGTIG